MGARGMAKAYHARPKNWDIYDELVKYKTKLSAEKWDDIFPPTSFPFVQPPVNRDGTMPDEGIPSQEIEPPTNKKLIENPIIPITKMVPKTEIEEKDEAKKPWDQDVDSFVTP